MQVVSQISELRPIIQQWKQTKNIALVPTMGHLHAGHMSLIDIARSSAVKTVVTIFVNPLQFNQTSDLTNYPRTLEADLQKLAAAKVDLVFTPSVDELYPQGLALAPQIEIPELGNEFCGQYRPGHFAGVCTVVTKLFNLIEPDIAVFGEKDYQQLLIIKQLSHDLNFPVEIKSGPTIRESDGLALSSRNASLTTDERRAAPQLYTTLCALQSDYSIDLLEERLDHAKTCLARAGLRPEYLAMRDAENLQNITQATDSIVVLGSAWIGKTRLIDNLRFPSK